MEKRHCQNSKMFFAFNKNMQLNTGFNCAMAVYIVEIVKNVTET